MEKTGWKVLAIVFMVLFVLETLFVIWMAGLGTDMINKENECAINICENDEYVSYYYDDWQEICYCMDAEGEILHAEIME